MTDRKKPGVAFSATVGLVVLLAYPVSFGPACWITSQMSVGAETVSVMYRPIIRAASHNESILTALQRYSRFGSRSNWAWIIVSLPSRKTEWRWMGVTLKGKATPVFVR
jgi:hypothetical protein